MSRRVCPESSTRFCQEALVGSGGMLEAQSPVGASGFGLEVIPEGRVRAKGAVRSSTTGVQFRAHEPAWQVSPAAQVVPAFAPAQSPLAPQWVALVRGSRQAPPQATWPDGGAGAELRPGRFAPEKQTDPGVRPRAVAAGAAVVDAGLGIDAGCHRRRLARRWRRCRRRPGRSARKRRKRPACERCSRRWRRTRSCWSGDRRRRRRRRPGPSRTGGRRPRPRRRSRSRRRFRTRRS